MNPNMMTYEKVDREKVQIEIEKSLFKARYEFMRRSQEDEDGGEETDEVNETETLDVDQKTVDYSKMRATDMCEPNYPPAGASQGGVGDGGDEGEDDVRSQKIY